MEKKETKGIQCERERNVKDGRESQSTSRSNKGRKHVFWRHLTLYLALNILFGWWKKVDIHLYNIYGLYIVHISFFAFFLLLLLPIHFSLRKTWMEWRFAFMCLCVNDLKWWNNILIHVNRILIYAPRMYIYMYICWTTSSASMLSIEM